MNSLHNFRTTVGRLRSFVRSFRNRAVILLYHRVTTMDTDPQLLCVAPQHFAEHLEILQRDYHPLSLSQLRERLHLGNIPRKAVVVTFDDGYADNLLQAKPLLERFRIPVTVFVTTGKIAGTSEFWWDELEALLSHPPTLPHTLQLRVQERSLIWNLGEAVEKAPPIAGVSSCWNVLMDSYPTARERIYAELSPLLRELACNEQESVLEQLAQWAGTPRRVRPNHRTMRDEELVELAAGGLIEIGAHAVTHSVLARQSAEAQQWEIMESKRRLEQIVRRPISAFSYPFGGKRDYTNETVVAVQRAGYTSACANSPGVIWRKADPFQLNRFIVHDWPGQKFAGKLQEWFHG